MPYTRADLRELIDKGEGSGLEFKRDVLTTNDLAEELVAFANSHGGIVLLGVEDDGTVIGLTRENLEEWVMNIARDLIRPELIPYFEVVPDMRNGQDVAVLRVEQSWAVHYVSRSGRFEPFIRVGSQTRRASPEELERLMQQRGRIRAELRPVSGSSMTDLDRRRLHDYLVRLRGQEAPNGEEAWQVLLENLEFLGGEGDPRSATLASMVLFGRNPRKFLPQTGITAAAFSGTEKDYAAIERTRLVGPMIRLEGEEGLVEAGLVEQALAFVARTTSADGGVDEMGRRIDEGAYPIEAIREGVVNALIHRDYLLSGADIELWIYQDRLEVVSPGRLPNSVTPERMRVGIRETRNQLIKEVMRDYRYVEDMGMGISRKIIPIMREHNGTEPDLIEEGERFTVRLWRRARDG